MLFHIDVSGLQCSCVRQISMDWNFHECIVDVLNERRFLLNFSFSSDQPKDCCYFYWASVHDGKLELAKEVLKLNVGSSHYSGFKLVGGFFNSNVRKKR